MDFALLQNPSNATLISACLFVNEILLQSSHTGALINVRSTMYDLRLGLDELPQMDANSEGSFQVFRF